MRRNARILASWVVATLVLVLLVPAAPAADGKAGTAAAPTANAASQAAPKPVVPPAPAEAGRPSAATGKPSAPESEAEDAEAGEEESHHEGRGGGDKLAVMSDVDVVEGQEVHGDVVCIGGKVKLQGKVRGDVVVIGGSLDMLGSTRGSVVGVGSKLVLHPGASVGQDLVNVAGGLDRGGASVGGKVVNIGVGGRWLAHLPGPFGMLGFILFWIKLLKLVLVFIGLLLLAAFVPDRIRLMSEEAPLRPFLAFFAGLGAYIVLTMTMILLCITIIGIPAALLLYFAFIVVKWMGLAGVFHLVGKRIGRLLGRDFSLLGAILLGFLPFAVLRFLPFCIGTLIWFVLEAMAVGLVVLTRAGGRRYGLAPGPPTPPVPPVSTAPSPPVPAP
ncbi:MAG: hypothetical protein LAO51_01865 [Acidobacteriia bacterium]|nr:hypothetical protein [Terriglobia bacterium]